MPDILKIIAIIIGGLIAFMFVMRTIRRFTIRRKEPPAEPTFDVAELNSMVEAGLISRDECEQLKSIVALQRSRQSDASEKHKGFEVIPLAKLDDAEQK